MKQSEIKKSLVRKVITSGIIILLFLGIMGGTFVYESSFSNDLDAIKQREISLIQQIRKEKENNKFIIETYENFKSLPKQKIPNNSLDLKSPAGRIRSARPIIEKLKRKYKISNIQILFSNPTKEESKLGENINVNKSTIEIDLSAANDEILFSFIYDIANELPGYVKMKSIKINKGKFEKSILIDAVKNDKPLKLISSQIILDWYSVNGEIFNFKKEIRNEKS